MAGAISVSVAVNVVNGAMRDAQTKQFAATQTRRGRSGRSYALTNTPADIDLSAMTAKGIAILSNLTDAGAAGANEIVFGPVSAGAIVPAVRIKPGESWPVRLEPSATYKARMNGAAETGILDVNAYED